MPLKPEATEVHPPLQLRARDFLIRGLLAGLLAGFIAFGVAYVVGEPSVNAAIAVEESGGTHNHDAGTAGHDQAEPAAGSDETEVPRSLQSTLGLLTGTAVAGTTLGGLLGVLSAFALGRFGRLGARATTLGVVGGGFLTVYVVPFLAYPPNPPAVGSGETIGYRSALFFIFVAISIIAGVVAMLVGRRLATRVGGWYASVAALGGYLLVVIIAMLAMPHYNEVPADFPATVLFDFRRASVLTQLSLWGVLGLALADLVHRITDRTRTGSREPSAVDVGA